MHVDNPQSIWEIVLWTDKKKTRAFWQIKSNQLYENQENHTYSEISRSFIYVAWVAAPDIGALNPIGHLLKELKLAIWGRHPSYLR